MAEVQEAIARLNQNDVVGMPTETVYGLAARIDSQQAIEKIFQIKERPFFDPLIVHVSSVDQAKKLVRNWPLVADVLAEKFWPGPLTMVLPKNESVSDLITSGLTAVGIRCPQHPLALELIEKVGVPLAAPSANKFGRTSPTLAAHVRNEFIGEDVYVLDGGPCQVGIESTVLQIVPGDVPTLAILRKGQVQHKDIDKALMGENFRWNQSIDKKSSPGHMKHHYMPSVPLILATNSALKVKELAEQVLARFEQLPSEVEGVKLIRPKDPIQKIEFLNLSKDPVIATREFYAKLRQSAERKPDIICFTKMDFHNAEAWEPLFERITKAASLIL